jgi:HEAT repeat protein
MDPAMRHIALVLAELGRAVKARSLLRAGDPRLEEVIERAHLACAAELARSGVLELVMDGRLLRLGHGGPRLTLAPAVELARTCSHRGLLGIRLDKDLELPAFCSLVESLADTPESQRPAGTGRRRATPTPPRELDPSEMEEALAEPVEAAIAAADPLPAPAVPDLEAALGEPLQEELPEALLSSLPAPEAATPPGEPGLGIEPDAVALPDEAAAGPSAEAISEAVAEALGSGPLPAPMPAEPAIEEAPDLAFGDAEPALVESPPPTDEHALGEPPAAEEPAAVAAPTPVAVAAPTPIAVAAPPTPPPAPAAPTPNPVAAATAPPLRQPVLEKHDDDTPMPVGMVKPSDRVARSASDDVFAEMVRLAAESADRRGRNDEQRLEAAARLRAVASGPRLDLLLQRACSDDTPSSLQASQVLLALGSDFIPKLLDAIAAEKHPKRRGHLNGILIAMGEAAAPHLVRELETADPVRARTTAWLAGEIQHPAAVPALTARLRGIDPVLRREAAKALAKISHPSAVSILVQTLDGKDAELAAQAAHCLAVSGQAHGLEAVRQRLHGACERNELPLAREILLMLGRRGRADVVPDLVAILGRKSLLRRQALRDLKIAALHALSKLPGDEARAALADVAANGDATIRDAAQGALARRGRQDPPAAAAS